MANFELYESSWSDLFASIDGYAWGYIGIAIAIGASITGAAW